MTQLLHSLSKNSHAPPTHLNRLQNTKVHKNTTFKPNQKCCSSPSDSVRLVIFGVSPKIKKPAIKFGFIQSFGLHKLTSHECLKVTIKTGFAFLSIPAHLWAVVEPMLLKTRVYMSGFKVVVDLAWEKSESSDRLQTLESQKKIYVGGITPFVKKSHLMVYFRRFGEIEMISRVYDRKTSEPKGFAFVKFTTVDAAQAALNCPQHFLMGQHLIVRSADPKKVDRAIKNGDRSRLQSTAVKSGLSRQSNADVSPSQGIVPGSGAEVLYGTNTG
jgi:hypothetical protein